MANSPASSSLMNNNIDLARLSSALQAREIRFLPLRERSLLRLLYYRGATQGELAGALGISRGAVRRMLRRAILRATDPQNLAILQSWHRLTDDERRLARLHRFMGISLNKIARQRLIAIPSQNGRSDDLASFGQLRGMMRAIQRKAQRHDRRREARTAHGGPAQSRQQDGDEGSATVTG